MKKTAVVGELEFTRGGMKKRLGDTITEYDYNSVSSLDLRKHFPNLWFSDSKSGYFSHILTISFTDGSSESLVLADKPLEKKPDTCIAGTLATLRKFINAEITIDAGDPGRKKKEGRGHSLVYNPLPNLPPGGKEQQLFPLGGNGKGGKTTNDNK